MSLSDVRRSAIVRKYAGINSSEQPIRYSTSRPVRRPSGWRMNGGSRFVRTRKMPPSQTAKPMADRISIGTTARRRPSITYCRKKTTYQRNRHWKGAYIRPNRPISTSQTESASMATANSPTSRPPRRRPIWYAAGRATRVQTAAISLGASSADRPASCSAALAYCSRRPRT